MEKDDDDYRGPMSPSPPGSWGKNASRCDDEGDEPDWQAPQERVLVRLVCRFCRDVQIIFIPARRNTPKEILWECFACQERRIPMGKGPFRPDGSSV